MKKEQEISKEEQTILDQRRDFIKRRSECRDEITQVLEKFNMIIRVNPSSQLNDLQIIIDEKN
ncbi:MAG: hypothetical protein HQ471_07715 [Flavobacteriales bacterium]|nr:hypothetical protein [Flavobacteriales bacterium]